jgi:hypothetical protein
LINHVILREHCDEESAFIGFADDLGGMPLNKKADPSPGLRMTAKKLIR